MPPLIVNKLPVMAALSLSLYDADLGKLLLAKGEPLTPEMIQALRDSGYETVFATNDAQEAESLRRTKAFQSMSLLSIKPDTIMANDLYDDQGTFLVSKGTKLSAAILSSLARRKVHDVMIRQDDDPALERRYLKARAAIDQLKALSDLPEVERAPFTNDEIITDSAALNVRSLNKIAQQMELSGKLEVNFDVKDALRLHLRRHDPLTARDAQKKMRFVDIYQDMIKRTGNLFEMLRNSVSIESNIILDVCDDLVRALVADRELLLCSMFVPHPSADYLVKHSLNTTIVAINIATAHGYSPKMIVEVGYGALLMDIGMLDIPSEIRFKKDKLSLLEINELKRHTIYGMDRLQYIHHLPKTTPLIAYQSHERLDGSGYPHGKRTHAIHDYAKLVAVADVYHAMIADRPYRDSATLPYNAMEELLNQVAGGKIDRRFVRSLLAAISLFPVASWVRLNTGEVARVLQSKEHKFTKPAVVVLYDPQGEPCTPIRLDLENSLDREVVAAIRLENEDVLVGF